MADLSKIQFKRSSTSGSTPTGLSAGELAMNVKDARLFSSDGTNIIEFGLSKGGTIDGPLTINGSITTSGGGVFAHQDGNVYLNKSGATGWIDSLFLRKDISNTMTGNFTATGNVVANSGLFTSNDSYHYLRMGVSGTNNYSFGNYGGTFSFLNSNGNGSVLSLSPSSASFSSGSGSVSLGNIIFPSNSNGSNSNNDYSRGVGFTIENVDTSSSNYPTSMGSLMTSVLSDVRVFQLFAESGSQGLHYRSMRNDGSGNVSWSELYSTANKPSPSDVGSYSTSQSDSLFAPKANFFLNGSDAHMQGTGSSYLFMNGSGSSGVYNSSSRGATWAFDANGNLTSGNIPISNGGTGATTVAGAIANLGLGNAINPNFVIPGNYTGKSSWIKIANVKSSGTGVGKLSLVIYGGGNYGSGLSELNYVDISARINTSTSTDNNLLAHRRSSIGTTDTSFGYVANFSGSTISSYDIYLKDSSGWFAGSSIETLASTTGGAITGPAVDGNFGSWLSSEPANISYTEVRSLASNWGSDTIQIDGEFVSTNSNGVRISPDDSTSSTSTILRTDGNSFYVLLSNNGKNIGNNWNNLRPFAVNTSSGLVTMGNGILMGGGTQINDSLTVTNGVINTNDPSHYIDLGHNGNNAAKWVVYNGQHSFVNGNGNTTTTQFNNGTITTAGSISTTTDNSGIIAGNNGDLGLIKKSGSGAKVVIGSGNPFIIAKSNNSSISPSDTLTNIFSIDTGGNTHVMGTLQTDGAATLSGAIINNGLTVNGGSTITGTITAKSVINAIGNITTDGYVFVGGFPGSFVPPTQGGYIGWNIPSGRGQTAFMNHKGGGSGGFTFHNSDGKTQTVIVDISGSGDVHLNTGDLYVPTGLIYGKDSNHYIDMTSDTYTLSNYGGQFYFKNANGGAQAELSFSGNIRGSQWNGGWLNDYMEGRYANVTGQTFTGSVNFANNTWNKFGDDVQIGDRNVSGGLAIQGVTGDTTLALFEKGSTATSTNYKIVASGNNLGLYAPNNVNVHGSGGLYVDGVGSFGGSLGAASLSISGDSTLSGTITANGQVNINGSGLVVKNGVGSADSSGNYYTSGYRVSGRGSQFADTYFQEITGSYAYYGLHVTSGGADGWYQFRNNGDFHLGGGVIAGNNLGVGGAVYQTDGNLSGSAWGGYISDYLRNNFVAGVKQGSRTHIGGLSSHGDYTSDIPGGAWLVSSLTNGDDRITDVYYAYVMYEIGGNWVNTGN